MPLPPEKEARGSIGSPPSNRLRACALYPFSLPIPHVALNFDPTGLRGPAQQLLKHLKVDLYEFVKRMQPLADARRESVSRKSSSTPFFST
jgi:hypothetical protein